MALGCDESLHFIGFPQVNPPGTKGACRPAEVVNCLQICAVPRNLGRGDMVRLFFGIGPAVLQTGRLRKTVSEIHVRFHTYASTLDAIGPTGADSAVLCTNRN